MAAIHNFRSALGGFNRSDVVQYIEYMNNKHNAHVEQLNTQLQNALAELAKAKNPAPDPELVARAEAAEARCAELEAALAKAQEEGAAICKADELETYRRAERTERLARDRAAQIYAQANAVLADATVRVDSAAAQIGSAADQFAAQLQSYQETVLSSKALLEDAVATMNAIRPEE